MAAKDMGNLNKGVRPDLSLKDPRLAVFRVGAGEGRNWPEAAAWPEPPGGLRSWPP